MAKNIVFCKCVGRRMIGIVKILLSTVRTFATLLKCTNYAHQIFLKLQHVENTVLLSLELALKIRVSAVRFCPRPPYSPSHASRAICAATESRCVDRASIQV